MHIFGIIFLFAAELEEPKIGISGKGLTLSQTTNLRLSEIKEYADGDFKLDENGRKFSKRKENTVGRGEIARYMHSVFKRLVL